MARQHYEAAVADFNLDGFPDILTQANGRLWVGLNNGDATFDNTDIGPGEFFGIGYTDTPDFNNDGLPDFITKFAVERHIDVYLNDVASPGSFERSFRHTVEAQGPNVSGFDHAVTTGDFNEDGNIDFVAVDGDNNNGEPMTLVTWAGDGLGGFSLVSESTPYEEELFSGFYYSGDLASGDLNEDGHLDVVSFTLQGALIHLGNGDGSFTTTDRYPYHSQEQRDRDAQIVDFDGDGHLDFVRYAGATFRSVGGAPQLAIRTGNGDGTFNDLDRVSLSSTAIIIGAFDIADFDNDGHLDFAHMGFRDSSLHFYAGQRDGLVDVLAVDLNGDGNEEVLAVNVANDRLKLFVGDYLGGLTRQNDLLTGRAPQAVAAVDLNGDGASELITANRASRTISVFSGSVETGYNNVDFPVGNGPIDVATGDLNGDGRAELVVLDEVDNAVWIFAGNGTLTLDTPSGVALGDNPGSVEMADATGDGTLDVVVSLSDTQRIMILPGTAGSIELGAPIYVATDASPSDIAVLDLNDDGNPDIAVTVPDEDVLSVFYGRGNNQFAKAQNIHVGDQPTRVTIADADEDGRLDLVVNNLGDSTASVIYNRFDPNEVYRYDADAVDPDNDTLTYDIVDGPGGLIINSKSGELLWAASPDQVGVHDVMISADDGRGGVATQSFKIDVQAARENAEPLFATEPIDRIGAGETLTYNSTALDDDRDALRYRLLEGPDGATIDPTTGVLTWDGTTDEALTLVPFVATETVYIQVPTNETLRPASLTVESWFKHDSLVVSNGAANLISLPNGSGSAWSLEHWGNRGNNELRLRIDFAAPELEDLLLRTPFSAEQDRWYHYAISFDDATRVATIYVDGVAIATGTAASSIEYNPEQDLFIANNVGRYTDSTIDNYRIWNIARSEAEIQEGLTRQYDGDERLVLDYRFDRPHTRNVRDFSQAGNHGLDTDRRASRQVCDHADCNRCGRRERS